MKVTYFCICTTFCYKHTYAYICMHTHTHTHAHTLTHTHTHTHTHMHTHAHTYTHTYTHAHTHTHAHIHMHTHTYTHTHTHTHTQTTTTTTTTLGFYLPPRFPQGTEISWGDVWASQHREPSFKINMWYFLQVFEMTESVTSGSEAAIMRIVRAPRPLVLLRVFRNFFKFQLPKNRMNSIFK